MRDGRTIGSVLRVAGCALLMTTALSAHSADISLTSRLVSVYPGATGTFMLTFSDNVPGCGSSSTPKRFVVKVGENGMTAEGAKQIYAAALAALLADKDVFFSFSAKAQQTSVTFHLDVTTSGHCQIVRVEM